MMQAAKHADIAASPPMAYSGSTKIVMPVFSVRDVCDSPSSKTLRCMSILNWPCGKRNEASNPCKWLKSPSNPGFTHSNVE